MGFATGTVKYLVFLANLIFVVAGLALITLGVIFRFSYLESVNTHGVPEDFGLASIVLIAVGAIVFVIAFFGCCGAIRESTCMLTTYAIILLLIFIIQVAVGVLAFLQVKDSPDYRNEIQKGLTKTFDKYDRDPNAKQGVDAIQTFLECCGVRGPEEWHFLNGSVPLSCCSHKEASCSAASPYVYHRGCTDALFRFLEKSAKLAGYIALGIAAVELIGALLGLCLASSIRNHYRRNIYA